METPLRWTTNPNIDKGAANLPEKRWVERMSDTNNYESHLWKLLEKETLADLSQFHQHGFFDEVPLCSRKSDLDFLLDDENEANKIVLRFALKFLKSVVAYEKHPTGYFAAITVWDFSDEILIPNVFVWCGSVRKLKKKLALSAATTPFAKQIKKLVPRLRLGDQFTVLEDTVTVPDTTRVFITLSDPPYDGFVTLDHFCKAASTLK
jgi:hypothetical protein